MADLYINGLYWRSEYFPTERESLRLFVSSSTPEYKAHGIEEEYTYRDIAIETIEFIRVGMRTETGEYKEFYNLDDPNIYVDLVTNDLRTRKVGDYSESMIIYKQRKEVVEEPIKNRFEILDL